MKPSLYTRQLIDEDVYESLFENQLFLKHLKIRQFFFTLIYTTKFSCFFFFVVKVDICWSSIFFIRKTNQLKLLIFLFCSLHFFCFGKFALIIIRIGIGYNLLTLFFFCFLLFTVFINKVIIISTNWLGKKNRIIIDF